MPANAAKAARALLKNRTDKEAVAESKRNRPPPRMFPRVQNMIDRRHFLALGALLSASAAKAQPLPEAALRAGIRPGGGEQIAMLLYPGFTALDFVGPYHFLSMPGATVHLVTNQSDLTPVRSDLGLAVQPTATFADCPADVTVLFTPGGTVGTLAAAGDGATLEFMRDRASRASFVTSVCTGSLILGAAGLLEGKRATSHWSVVPELARFGAIPVRERVVRDGKLITGAGVSAGLDFGSTLVAEMRGHAMAEAAVLMAEYDPHPPVRGGSIDTARPEIANLLSQSLSGFVADARRLGGGS